MSDDIQQWQTRPVGDRDFEGQRGGEEVPPPERDIDYPDPGEGNPSASLSYDGGQGAEEESKPESDKDYPPPEIADNNGR